MNLLNNHRYALITGIVLAVVLALLIGGSQFNQLGLARWFHIVAGVFWIGLLYYFNVAQTPALADAAAFCSSVAATKPWIFFWFGQMMAQTLNNMMVPSQAPVPITRR